MKVTQRLLLLVKNLLWRILCDQRFLCLKIFKISVASLVSN